jgi:hypothetical protein
LLCSIAAALLLFSPWFVELHTHSEPQYLGINWFRGEGCQSSLFWSWLREATEPFVDVGATWNSAQDWLTALIPVLEFALITVFVRKAPKNSVTFLLTMLATGFCTLALPDLFLGGIRSLEARYQIPVVVSLQIMIGFALHTMISSRKKLVTGGGMFLFVVLVAAGVISCHSLSKTRVWWHGWGVEEVESARIINQCRAPIVLGWQKQAGWRELILALADELRPDVMLAFSGASSRSQDLMSIPPPPQVSDVFIWRPTPEQIQQLKRDGRNFVRQPGNAYLLWKLVQ